MGGWSAKGGGGDKAGVVCFGTNNFEAVTPVLLAVNLDCFLFFNRIAEERACVLLNVLVRCSTQMARHVYVLLVVLTQVRSGEDGYFLTRFESQKWSTVWTIFVIQIV